MGPPIGSANTARSPSGAAGSLRLNRFRSSESNATLPAADRVSLPQPARTVPRAAWRGGAVASGVRTIPEEVPVALTYNRATLGVMLATPADLEDFAIGFSLTEGIISSPADVEELSIVGVEQGIELR